LGFCEFVEWSCDYVGVGGVGFGVCGGFRVGVGC